MAENQDSKQNPCNNTHPLDFRRDFTVNFISKNKQIGQSDFRLHFVLPNVKLGKRERVQELLNQIRGRVSKVGTPQTVQILERRKNFLDIGVGLRFDYQAIDYVHFQTKKILLMDSNSSYYEIVPLVCKAFYGYLEDIGKASKYKICNKQNLYLQRKLGQQKYRQKMVNSRRAKSNQKQQANDKYGRSNSQSKYSKSPQRHQKGSKSRSRDRRISNSPFRAPSQQYNNNRRNSQQYYRQPPQRRIVVAGIPLGMQYQSIDQQLYNQGFQVNKMIWIRKNQIELLEIKLLNNNDYEKFQAYGIRFKGQPVACFIIHQHDSQNSIVDNLRDYQIRVQFKSSIDKVQAVDMLSRYGNVVDCLEQRDSQRCFFVTFSKKQAVSSILSARDPNFQSFLDKAIFPIRRKPQPSNRQRRQVPITRQPYRQNNDLRQLARSTSRYNYQSQRSNPKHY